MLDSRRLLTLRAVFQTGSFPAAAAQLGYTQSAVSQQIADLESAAGLRLLQRRPVRPTAAGLVALRAANAQAEALRAATTELRSLREGRSGVVRLATFASAAAAVAAPALARFRATHPKVRLTVLQLETADAEAALLDGRADLALTFDYDAVPSSPPAAVSRTPLGDDPVFAALPLGHPLAHASSLTLAALAKEGWIAAPLAGVPLAILREQVAIGGFEPALRYEGDDFAAVLAHVAAGLGVALLPGLALGRVPDGVAITRLAEAPITRRLHLSRLRTQSTPPSIAALEAVIVETCRSLMSV